MKTLKKIFTVASAITLAAQPFVAYCGTFSEARSNLIAQKVSSGSAQSFTPVTSFQNISGSSALTTAPTFNTITRLAPALTATVLKHVSAATAIKIIGNQPAGNAAAVLNALATNPAGTKVAAAIMNGTETVAAAAILSNMETTPAQAIIASDAMPAANAAKIFSQMSLTSGGAAYTADILWSLHSDVTTSAKAAAVLNGLTGDGKELVEESLGEEKTTLIASSTQETTQPSDDTTAAGDVTTASTSQLFNGKTLAEWKELLQISSGTKCMASNETFPDGGITIFWTNEEAIPVQDLNLALPGWQLHMIITADFDNNGTAETQDWLMDASMVSRTGRSVDLDMPPELDGKNVTVSFYVTDANGNPLIKQTDEETNTTSWAIGSKANGNAYIFGGAEGSSAAVSFMVHRDPAAGEQAPKVTGYALTGRSLTINFATPLDPWYFTAAYIVVDGIYTQISDYRYMLSNDKKSLTVDLNAFGINIPTGAKVEFVVKEWAHGMTPKQTVIAGTTTPTTTPVSIAVGDSVTLGDKTFIAQTAFTYNADGTIPANIHLNDAQGRAFTTTAAGLDQNSFLAGDPIEISGVDYTVTTAFAFQAGGTIPQGTKFADAANHVYIADAAGALVLESAVTPVSIAVGDSVTLGDTTFIAQTAFTYNADGTIPANIHLNDAQGRLFTTTATGLDQNSFLAGDPIEISGVNYTVTTPFTFPARGKIPQGTKFADAANHVYIADAAGALVLESAVTPTTNQTVTLTDNTVLTAQTTFNYNADGSVPAGIRFTSANGKTYISSAGGQFEQVGFIAGEDIQLTGNVTLTVQTPFCRNTDGTYPTNVVLVDSDNNKWTITSDGSFRQTTTRTITLTDQTVLTTTTEFAFTDDGGVPAGIRFTSANGKTYVSATDGQFEQIGFIAGEIITLTGGATLTVQTPFCQNTDGTYPTNVVLLDAENNEWTITSDGRFRLL
ncbi:MAG: hypothetical protein WC547_01330 [Candidatus Omnitrophota bacterium]